MAWLAVDGNGEEYIYEDKPHRDPNLKMWVPSKKEYWEESISHFVELKKGTIQKLIGQELNWENDPQEY